MRSDEAALPRPGPPPACGAGRARFGWHRVPGRLMIRRMRMTLWTTVLMIGLAVMIAGGAGAHALSGPGAQPIGHAAHHACDHHGCDRGQPGDHPGGTGAEPGCASMIGHCSTALVALAAWPRDPSGVATGAFRVTSVEASGLSIGAETPPPRV